MTELLHTADRLGIQRLANLCEQQLLQSLEPQNCLQLWQLGEDGNHSNVLEAAVSAALQHFERVVQVCLAPPNVPFQAAEGVVAGGLASARH